MLYQRAAKTKPFGYKLGRRVGVVLSQIPYMRPLEITAVFCIYKKGCAWEGVDSPSPFSLHLRPATVLRHSSTAASLTLLPPLRAEEQYAMPCHVHLSIWLFLCTLEIYVKTFGLSTDIFLKTRNRSLQHMI